MNLAFKCDNTYCTAFIPTTLRTKFFFRRLKSENAYEHAIFTLLSGPQNIEKVLSGLNIHKSRKPSENYLGICNW